MRIGILFGIVFSLAPCLVYAQDIQEAAPPFRQELYQIFLESPVEKVNKVTYSDDSGPIEFKLAPDGRSIHLLNYKGEGGVKAEVVKGDGLTDEVERSKCAVHSLQEM